MTEPARAVVRPRVVSPETGDIVLLEDEAAAWVDDRRSLALEIVGGAGLGKTTALRHLAATLESPGPLTFIDEPTSAEVAAAMASGRIVYATSEPLRLDDTCSLRLASWSEDEWIEYLRSVHPACCASVISRLRTDCGRRRLHGVPELWRIVLDEMMADESACDVLEVLRRRWRADFDDPQLLALVERYCLAKITNSDDLALRHLARAARTTALRHRVGQVMFAAQHLTEMLAKADRRGFSAALGRQLPDDLIDATAGRVARSPEAAEQLRALLTKRAPALHAMAATLLHAAAVGWQPISRRLPNLSNARLTGAAWPGIDLRRALLNQTDLAGADLSRANLDGAKLRLAVLRRANLTRATLNRIRADHADFSNADLSHASAANARLRSAVFCSAQLTGANLHASDFTRADFSAAGLQSANLMYADLSEAVFEQTDLAKANLGMARLRRAKLSSADLSNVRFTGADLTECDLEGVCLPDAEFEGVNFTRAYLTCSSLPHANLRHVILREAGLADVAWHDADLRHADFTGCAFHLGSSRSGLVGSPLACEGSRTGFYTDDYNEQDFKSPEEIRKADLRGANLLGATVEAADFYLVDLRGATYSLDQAEHFRRCGAILFDRVNH